MPKCEVFCRMAVVLGYIFLSIVCSKIESTRTINIEIAGDDYDLPETIEMHVTYEEPFLRCTRILLLSICILGVLDIIQGFLREVDEEKSDDEQDILLKEPLL